MDYCCNAEWYTHSAYSCMLEPILNGMRGDSSSHGMASIRCRRHRASVCCNRNKSRVKKSSTLILLILGACETCGGAVHVCITGSKWFGSPAYLRESHQSNPGTPFLCACACPSSGDAQVVQFEVERMIGLPRKGSPAHFIATHARLTYERLTNLSYSSASAQTPVRSKNSSSESWSSRYPGEERG